MIPPFWLRPVSDYQLPYPRKNSYKLCRIDKLLPTRNSLSTKELLGEFLYKMVSVLVESNFIHFFYFVLNQLLSVFFLVCIRFGNVVS